MGDVDHVRHKLAVLHAHCAEVGRDPATIKVTHLSTILLADGDEPAPPGAVAGTVEDHVGRFRELAEAGVQTAIVRFADADLTPATLEAFAPVMAAFRQAPG